MAFVNLGFETEGSEPGLAGGWTLVSTGLAFQIAAYGDSAPLSSYEGFEVAWDNDDYLFEFTVVDITPAEYLLTDNKFYEDFEESWDNDDYVFDLTATAASYDSTPESYEDFEEDWDSNQSYVYTFSGTAALYGLGSEAYESFDNESDWGSSFEMVTI